MAVPQIPTKWRWSGPFDFLELSSDILNISGFSRTIRESVDAPTMERPMKRDAALPYILADEFLGWWKETGEPEVRAAFTYWADRQTLRARRRESVWRRVAEIRQVPGRPLRGPTPGGQ
jgi:hypothetical protein